jgi:hypothetical protein
VGIPEGKPSLAKKKKFLDEVAYKWLWGSLHQKHGFFCDDDEEWRCAIKFNIVGVSIISIIMALIP